jgi:glycosyltransferase involved in cell wall biosynthesis
MLNIGVDLRCLQTPYRTGVGEYTFELLSAILRIDKVNNYYLYSNSFSPVELPKFNGNNVFEVKFRFPNRLLNFSSLLLSRPKADELIKKKFNLNKLDYFFSPNLNFISLTKETKHILTVHDLTFDILPDFLTVKQLAWHRLTRPKKQCKEAYKILTPSENTKRDLISFYNIDPHKIKVIYPGISSNFASVNNNETVKSKYNLPDNFLLFIGTIEPRKNISSLIRAFEEAGKSLPEKYFLIIAGSPGWKNQEVLKLIQNSPARDLIRIIGYIDDKDKPDLYRRAKLFIYPSFYEGFGFPVLEAMHAGVPVITSNRSSLPELAGNACHLINPHRPAEICSAITKIIGDKIYRQKLIADGIKRAEKFNWENAAKEWLSQIS